MFQSHVEDTYRTVLALRKQSEVLYKEAQSLLLSELGLADWQPTRQAESIRSFSEAWGAGRMDAEYFQPKYDDVVNAIMGYHGGWDTLGNLVDVNDLNFNPGDTAMYKYIELANIGGNGEISGCTIAPGVALPTRARRKVEKGDVIVSSIEGSLGSIAMIDDEYDGALCSTGFYVVDSRGFNSETLMVILKSIAGQLQLKKGCSGTILTAINQHEFRKVVLPIIPDYTQAEIRRKVAESAAARRQSRELLEQAKRAVEIAIEQDERAAISWLKDRIDSDAESGEDYSGLDFKEMLAARPLDGIDLSRSDELPRDVT